MIGACGMGNSLISVAAAGNGYLEGNLVDKVLGDKDARAELDALLMRRCDAAKAIVAAHPEVVEALRDHLLERDELVGSEITDVIEAALAETPEPAVITELRPSGTAAAASAGPRARRGGGEGDQARLSNRPARLRFPPSIAQHEASETSGRWRPAPPASASRSVVSGPPRRQ